MPGLPSLPKASSLNLRIETGKLAGVIALCRTVPASTGIGRSRGGLTSKIHAVLVGNLIRLVREVESRNAFVS